MIQCVCVCEREIFTWPAISPTLPVSLCCRWRSGAVLRARKPALEEEVGAALAPASTPRTPPTPLSHLQTTPSSSTPQPPLSPPQPSPPPPPPPLPSPLPRKPVAEELQVTTSITTVAAFCRHSWSWRRESTPRQEDEASSQAHLHPHLRRRMPKPDPPAASDFEVLRVWKLLTTSLSLVIQRLLAEGRGANQEAWWAAGPSVIPPWLTWSRSSRRRSCRRWWPGWKTWRCNAAGGRSVERVEADVSEYV